MKRAFLITTPVILALSIIAIAIFRPSEVKADLPMQNQQCQYPLRSTNPPGGCDNSDPCDPADAVKGGSGECKDLQTHQANVEEGSDNANSEEFQGK